MKRNVILSNRAKLKLDNLFLYLENEWSEKVKNEFIGKLNRIIEILSNNPKTFPASKKYPEILRCVLSRQISIFYKFDRKNIYIITVFDNRQNPQKLDNDLI